MTLWSSQALGQGKPDGAKVPAIVVTPEQRAITHSLRVPGTLVPDRQVDLFAKTSGYVSMIKVDIGDRVSKGDELVTISVPEMQDELRQMDAVLEAEQAKVRALEAKASQAHRAVDIAHARVRRQAAVYELDAVTLKRRQELHQGDAIPQSALDEALAAAAASEAQFRAAEAQVAGAQAERQAVGADVTVARADVMVARASAAKLRTLMQYTTIKAPFDGVITVRSVDHGTFVRSAAKGTTSPLLRIAKMDRIRVIIEVPQSDVALVRVGTKAHIEVKALGAGGFDATVSRTAGALKPQTRTMRVEIDVENCDGHFLPGMYALVKLELETKAMAMVIPSKAIRLEVTSGLGGNEQIITSTSGSIAPGVPVTPTPAS
jgi:multidrug resistance efflux pump